METPFLAALVDMAGGSETLVSPMGAPACGFNVAAHAGCHPWFQHSRHTKRAAMTPERTAAKTILVCRSFGIGSPITGVYDVTYYTAALHASSILRAAERNFRPLVRKSRPNANLRTLPPLRKTTSQQSNNTAIQQYSKKGPHRATLYTGKFAKAAMPPATPDAACQCGRQADPAHQTAPGAARAPR